MSRSKHPKTEQILEMAHKGMRNVEIAKKLNLKPHTVGNIKRNHSLKASTPDNNIVKRQAERIINLEQKLQDTQRMNTELKDLLIEVMIKNIRAQGL